MNLEKMRRSIYQYYIDNPCLSEEIDYESEEVRKAHYIKMVNEMTEKEITEEYETRRRDFI